MNTTYKKEKIGVMCGELDNFDTWLLTDVIEALNDLNNHYIKHGCKNIKVDCTYENGPGYYELYGDRLETDEEFEQRIKKENKLKENHEKDKIKGKKDRFKQYQKLKKEFVDDE